MSLGVMTHHLLEMGPYSREPGLYTDRGGPHKNGLPTASTNIEAVLLGRPEIGAIFEKKLRDAYDYLFEEWQEGGCLGLLISRGRR